MTPAETDTLVRQLIGGDPAAAAAILSHATTSTESLVLTAAALLDPDTPELLHRAVAAATDRQDRQLAALAAAHLAGDRDRVTALAREHLLDHPDSVLAAWIAAGVHQPPRQPRNYPLRSVRKPVRGRISPGPHPGGILMNRKLTAALLIAAAVLTNAAFTVLGTLFNYPDVLKEPTADILGSFRAHQGPVTFWFAVMAVSAALFAPIAVGVGRLSSHRALRWAVPAGVAAAVVQVIGLSRWPLLVPRFATDAASADPTTAAHGRDAFETAHFILGNVIGETLGYLFTAAWTLLVLVALHRTLAGRWFTALGAVSAVLIVAGVLSPLDLPIIDTANFAGYVLWSLWLIAFAALLLVRRVPATMTSSRGASLMPARG